MKKWLLIPSIALLAAAAVLTTAYFYRFAPSYPSSPDDALISFEDLTRFAAVHREAGGSAASYQSRYFDLAGKPVRIWESRFGINAADLAAHVAERPALYEEFSDRVAALAATEPEIREAYRKLERLYSDAVYSPLHVFFGSYSVRSLIRPVGILMSGEYFTGMPAAMDPTSDLYLRGLMAEPERIVSQVLHEQVHIQQARHNPLAMFAGTVLERTLFEGGADFVSEFITGAHNNRAAIGYVERHGEALWCDFHRAIDRSYRDHWIDVDRYGRPPSGIAGAFGYSIAEAYYRSFEEPEAGLRALLELEESYEEIFRRSGFERRLDERCG